MHLKQTAAVALSLAFAASAGAVPEGWAESRHGAVTEWSSPRSASLLPVEWTVRFRAPAGSFLIVSAVASPDVHPVLTAKLRVEDHAHALITVGASGEPLDIADPVREDGVEDPGTLVYGWRYAKVGNLWEERDRLEIGSALDSLSSFDEKVFTLRLTLKNGLRQVWLDDRLVGETARPNPLAAALRIEFQDVSIEEVLTIAPLEIGSFLILPLTAWSHGKAAASQAGPVERGEIMKPEKRGPPVLVPPSGVVDINLGDSLHRHRASVGRGPNSPGANMDDSWPGPFSIDPAFLAFRVPNRPWQNLWLLAWVDDAKGAVPAGALRFYQPGAGHPVDMPFAVDEAAIRMGLVRKLELKSAEGKPLVLIKVPLLTGALDELRQRDPRRLSFVLTKPLALFRGYPEPGRPEVHPAGPPSSLHVLGMTLEEAPFDYVVTPDRPGHVFQRPEKASYTVTLTNRSDRAFRVDIKLGTDSFDGTEKGGTNGALALEKRGSGELKLELDPALNGWHALHVQVEGDGFVRSNRLSLVMLPVDGRSHGHAENETRFGIGSMCGHDLPFVTGADEHNEAWLSVFRKLGFRRMPRHPAFGQTNSLAQFDFIPAYPRLFVSDIQGINEKDSRAVSDLVSREVARVAADDGRYPGSAYVFGGRWAEGRDLQYASPPIYTGDAERIWSGAERNAVERQVKLFEAVAEGLRYQYPKTRLFLQGDGPVGALVYMRAGLLKVFADGFGVTGPAGGWIPENPAAQGSIQGLWALNREAVLEGWTNRPVLWAVDPDLSTGPGALTERRQADLLVRHWLAGLALRVNIFESGVTALDAGCSCENARDAGLFHWVPLGNPKPAAAAAATATAMLGGFEFAGAVDSGVPTTLCMAFRNVASGGMRYALWRVAGRARAVLRVEGGRPVLTDGMGNAREPAVMNGEATVMVGESPVWLTGVDKITRLRVEFPEYDKRPAPVTRPLPAFTEKQWVYEGKPDSALSAEFEPGEAGHAAVLAVILPAEPGDQPPARRRGILRARRPVPIIGNPSALGVWVRGNGSWGRIAYRIRDAKGETWSSWGARNAWWADDPHGWSLIDFEGWRYVRFPLPGLHPRDGAWKADAVWWESQGGDGVPDLPFSLLDIVFEACNEAPVAGEMKIVPDRVYKLAGLVAEYTDEADALPAAARASAVDPPPAWRGPIDNPMAELARTGAEPIPSIGRFDEPAGDGFRRRIRFAAKPGMAYNLYVSRYEDGAGAERLTTGVVNGMAVDGFRPGVPYFLFLTAVGPDGKESKPSKPFRLVTSGFGR